MHFNLKLITSFTAALAFVVLASGEEKLLFKQKLQTGKTYVLSQEMNNEITAAFGVTKQKTVMNVSMAVTQPTPEEKHIVLKFNGIEASMNALGKTVEVNTDDPTQREKFETLLTMNPVLVYDSDGNFLRDEGFAELDAGDSLALAANPEALKQLVNGLVGALPTEAIAPGHRWESDLDMPIPSVGGKVNVLLNNEFKQYETIDGNKCAVVHFTGAVTGKVEAKGVPVQFKEGSTFNGSYYFDPAIGYNRKQVVDMDLIIGMGTGGKTMGIPMKIKQTVDLVKVRNN